MKFFFLSLAAVSSVSFATEPFTNNINTNNSTASSASTSNNNNTNSLTNSASSNSVSTGVAGSVTSSAVSGPSASNALSSSDSSATVSANGAGASSNNLSLTQNYQAHRAPVATAFAASLTSGIDTCLGSGAGGVQTQMLGVSVGKTLTDENCVMIKQVQLLRELGLESAACFRARAGKEGAAIDAAMRAANVDCNALPQPVSAPVIENHDHVNRNELGDYVRKVDLAEHEKRITKGLTRK